MNGIRIYPAPYAPPDFYVIHDWKKPQQSATPEWRDVWVFKGAMYAHPSIIEKLKEQTK